MSRYHASIEKLTINYLTPLPLIYLRRKMCHTQWTSGICFPSSL